MSSLVILFNFARNAITFPPYVIRQIRIALPPQIAATCRSVSESCAR